MLCKTESNNNSVVSSWKSLEKCTHVIYYWHTTWARTARVQDKETALLYFSNIMRQRHSVLQHHQYKFIIIRLSRHWVRFTTKACDAQVNKDGQHWWPSRWSNSRHRIANKVYFLKIWICRIGKVHRSHYQFVYLHVNGFLSQGFLREFLIQFWSFHKTLPHYQESCVDVEMGQDQGHKITVCIEWAQPIAKHSQHVGFGFMPNWLAGEPYLVSCTTANAANSWIMSVFL